MKDTSIIPKGPYCYTWLELPRKENNYTAKTQSCPYYEVKDINGVEIAWCNYLDMGGTPGDGKWKGWKDYNKAEQILVEHFGSQEQSDEKLSLFLLFDSTKECGVNYEEESDNNLN